MEVIKFLQGFSNPFLDKIFLIITMLGEEYIPIMILVFIFWCKDKKYGYKLGFILTFNIIINGCIKDIFKSPRPIGKKGIRSLRKETATGYSFPSGHTQNTTALFSSLIIETKNRYMEVLGVIIIFLVAISRLYLGVHWPKDVLAGIIFGILNVIIANYIFEIEDIKKRKNLFIILICLSLIGNIFFTSADYAKASGVFLGFFLGYFVEDKYIKFKVEGSKVNQVIKIIIGLSLVVFIRTITKMVLPDSNISNIIRYALIGFCCTAGAPYLFLKLKIAEGEI